MHWTEKDSSTVHHLRETASPARAQVAEKKIRLNWKEVFLINDGDTSPLQDILKKNAKVFVGELGSMKDIAVKLTV